MALAILAIVKNKKNNVLSFSMMTKLCTHVVLKKEDDPSKRLLCYNLHPNNNPSQTLSKVKEILMKESL